MATLRGEGYMEAGSSTALMAMSETTMIERVDKAKFIKDLSSAEKKRLALVCITYGFDPIMGEMTIYEGNPYVSVDGRYRKAQETGLLMGVESRPATKDERAMWEINTEDKFFRAVVKKLVGGTTAEFVGWGRVTAGEIERANKYIPVSTNPMRMAEKRAEVQALRKAFSIPLPAGTGSVENIIEGSYEVVDEETGEIKEAGPPAENKVKEPAKKKTSAKAANKEEPVADAEIPGAEPEPQAEPEPEPPPEREPAKDETPAKKKTSARAAKKEEPVADAEIPGAEPEPQAEPEPEPPPEREPAKDETPVTHAEGKEIERLFSHDGAFDPASMGEFCNAQRNWGIRQIVQLKKWQYDVICGALRRGA